LNKISRAIEAKPAGHFLGRILILPMIENRPERGVYAASSFGSPQANRFIYARSDTEAA
jgi:hypothetical protein